MEDNDKFKKPHYPRKNASFRPPPGVQKAIQNFGVKDLRELLDKKQQDKFEDDKKPEPKHNRPPPDPPYNYLKDPIRDVSHQQPEDKRHTSRGGHQRPRNEDLARKEQTRSRELQRNNDSHPATPDSADYKEQKASKKELRFMDPVDDKTQFPRGGKSSFRTRSHRRGLNVRYTEPNEEKLENLVNIKIQLSTETGQRNCVLDESTKIADIKCVPDQVHAQGSLKRGPGSRGRGYFRGRGRGRGSFRGKREAPNRSTYLETTEDEKEHDVKHRVVDSPQNPETKTDEGTDNTETEEFVDSNETYDELAGVYSEAGLNNLDKSEEVTSPFNATLVKTLTITSQKFQDGDTKRSVEVIATKEGESNAHPKGERQVK